MTTVFSFRFILHVAAAQRVAVCGFVMILLMLPCFTSAQEVNVDTPSPAQTAQVHTAGEGLTSKIAPGEILPISVTLSNFGNTQRVDVRVAYDIVSADGDVIYTANETVAVETTASFVKTIQIPFDTPSGRYIAKSSVAYEDQVVPATTQFPFIVERKIAGLFLTEFYLYGGVVLLVSALAGMGGHLWVKRRRVRSAPIKYPTVPRSERLFYELISDTIAQMRQHVGDQALAIAAKIDGLVINSDTGKVLKLNKSPTKIMALLVLQYEQQLGRRVSFALARAAGASRGHPSPADQNLVMIKKYLT